MGQDTDPIDELMETVARSSSVRARKGSFYSEDGDCVFFYNEDVSHFRERVDELLTVYRARDDGRIIGVQIKGIRNLPIHDVMRVEVSSNGPSSPETVILLLLTFQRQQVTTPPKFDAYRDAIKLASRQSFPVENWNQRRAS